ncbi:MAG: hypothetical protein WAW41_00285 [Methylobacter sp.]
MPRPKKYSYNPANAVESEEMERAKARYKHIHWTFEEIPFNDGSGKVWVVFTPPEERVPTSSKVSVATPSPSISSSGNLAWGAKVSATFRSKICKIAEGLGCNPDFLMAAMAFETGETFSPNIVNNVSGATGLIQFMPSTAVSLGTTTTALANMSAEDQLDFVAEYFANQKGKLHTLEDVYMAILWPAAVGKDNNHVLFTDPAKAYTQNKGLDWNLDGQVTKAEAAAKVRERLDKGMKPENIG